MTKIKNVQGVSHIVMKPTAFTLCAIGQDWYESEMEIHFTPSECYPDYMEVDKFIRDEIDGKELNIEEVVDKVYSFLQKEYEPQELCIINHVKNCKTHFAVDVIKE